MNATGKTLLFPHWLVEFLKKALAEGYGHDKIASDPDLQGLRGGSEFQQLIAAAKSASR